MRYLTLERASGERPETRFRAETQRAVSEHRRESAETRELQPSAEPERAETHTEARGVRSQTGHSTTAHTITKSKEI